MFNGPKYQTEYIINTMKCVCICEISSFTFVDKLIANNHQNFTNFEIIVTWKDLRG